MARRAFALKFEPLVAGLVANDPDEVVARVLDAATELVMAHGLRRCSVEDIAERSRLGRTTVYRRFDGKDEIVHALLAREARRVFGAISDAVAHLDTLEDRLVEGFITGVRAANSSSLGKLVRREPDLLPLLTADAGPLIGLARTALVEEYTRMTRRRPDAYVVVNAEVLVRLAISFVLAPESALDLLADDGRGRATCRRLFAALLAG